jgi:hypothetical protein
MPSPHPSELIAAFLRLVRWYVTPSGLGLATAIVASATGLMLDEPLLALAGWGMLGLFLPYKFARDRRDSIVRDKRLRHRLDDLDRQLAEVHGGLHTITSDLDASIPTSAMHRVDTRAADTRRLVGSLYRRVPGVSHRDLGNQSVIDAVAIHQMGKVGSMSIYEALRDSLDVEVFHTHYLNPGLPYFTPDPADVPTPERHQAVPPHIHRSRQLRFEYLDTGRPVGIITSVREPIGRNVSAFFQNLQHFTHGTGIAPTDTARLYELFLEQFPHDQPDTWFEEEFNKVFDLDVFAERFPQAGSQVLVGDGARILVLRTSLPDDRKVAAISEFIGIAPFSLESKNVRADTDLAATYGEFKQLVAADSAYVDKMLKLRVAQHFFTERERQDIRDRWTTA